MKISARVAVLFILPWLLAPRFASAEINPPFCPDCECTTDGIWDAWDAAAACRWAGGGYEAHCNVRRCRALNQGQTEGVCEPGSHHNIYTSPAPAITSPKCVFRPGPIGDGAP